MPLDAHTPEVTSEGTAKSTTAGDRLLGRSLEVYPPSLRAYVIAHAAKLRAHLVRYPRSGRSDAWRVLLKEIADDLKFTPSKRTVETYLSAAAARSVAVTEPDVPPAGGSTSTPAPVEAGRPLAEDHGATGETLSNPYRGRR